MYVWLFCFCYNILLYRLVLCLNLYFMYVTFLRLVSYSVCYTLGFAVRSFSRSSMYKAFIKLNIYLEPYSLMLFSLSIDFFKYISFKVVCFFFQYFI